MNSIPFIDFNSRRKKREKGYYVYRSNTLRKGEERKKPGILIIQ
jgi:hypothetical protein